MFIVTEYTGKKPPVCIYIAVTLTASDTILNPMQ